jgi:GNAT superfamily N-acetyltransferase
VNSSHGLADFRSGVPVLDDWLKRRALQNQETGATRTFVVCRESRVVAYHALASGGVAIVQAPGRFRRNMPDPIPVAVLARLAIDRTFQGQGLGRLLVADAIRRVLYAADAIGIRGILVHAISEDAAAFYTAVGFDPSPLDPLILMITLSDARKAVV